MQTSRHNAWREALNEQRRVVVTSLNNENGKQLISLLEKTFQGGLFDADPITMAKNVGQHDLVQYLKDLLKEGSENE